MAQITDRDLVGTWSLVTWDITYDDERPITYPWGADAQGMLIYAADHHVMVVVCSAGRPRLSTESVREAPVEQKVGAFETYFSYAGTWELRDGEVCHRISYALNPNVVGTDQIRQLALEGDKLTLSVTDRAKSVARHHRLLWRRDSGQGGLRFLGI
jgi:hypothetical protein